MKIEVRHLDRLLFLLSEKTKESLDRAGLRNIASQIKGISEDYLYKKIFFVIRNMKKDDTISLRDAQLNSVARMLGFKTFRAFLSAAEMPVDEQLRTLTGNYLAYVRQNSTQALIFQSPVEIKESAGKFTMSLKGPSWVYEGQLEVKHGCLFVLLAAPEKKSFYHIYKVGTIRNPRVIQGIFSGVSTAFDPIGGRVVLLKSDQSPVNLKNKALPISELRKSPLPEHKKLAAYFKEYTKNNLSINKVVSFGLDDLVQ
jgi:hypothetical protein